MADLRSDKDIKIVTGPAGITWGDSAGSGHVGDADGNPISGYTVTVESGVTPVHPDLIVPPGHVVSEYIWIEYGEVVGSGEIVADTRRPLDGLSFERLTDEQIPVGTYDISIGMKKTADGWVPYDPLAD